MITAVDERRNARVYLTGLAFSLLGTSSMILVAGIWIKTLTGSSSDAALVSACLYAPSLLGPIAGVVADRVALRRLLVGTNLASAVLVSSLLLVRSDEQVWLIYVVMTAYGASIVLIDPAETSLFAALFSPEVRPRINGLRLTLQESGKLVAPLAGAAVFAAFGGGPVAAIDALTFLIAALAVTRLRVPASAGGAPAATERTLQAWRRELLAGLAHIRRTPELRRVTALAALAMALSGVLVAAQFDLVSALHRPPSFLGVLTGVLGAGSILAGLVSGALIARFGELTVVLIGLADASVGSVLRATGSTVPVVIGSFVLGFALPWIFVAAITIAQRLTPATLQGRVSAALTLLLFGPQPLMQVAGAGLIATIDYRWLYLVAAVVQVAVIGIGLIRTGRTRRPISAGNSPSK